MPARRVTFAKKGTKKYSKKPAASRVAKVYPSRAKGKGAYTYDKPGPWGRLGRKAGEAVGGIIGGNYGAGGVGRQIGSKLGSYAHYIGKIFGSGDYVTSPMSMKSNSLMNSDQIPQFTSGKNIVRIQHREYLGDVISSATAGAFNIVTYPINPGIAITYPWLSQVCGATFQQYRINGQVYEFRTMSSDALNNVNTALGTVVMATDYDSADATFTNKQQMENTEFGVSCKPSCNMLHGIECARSQTSVSELYIRSYGIPTGADPRLYDMGQFSIATVGMQGTSVNLGELWVSYDITFFKSIEKVPGFLSTSARYDLTGYGSSDPFGNAAFTTWNGKTGTDTIGLVWTSKNRISFPSNITIGTTYRFQWGAVVDAAYAYTAPVMTCGNGLWAAASTDWTVPTNTNVVQTSLFSFDIQYKGGATPAAAPYINLANFTWAFDTAGAAELYVDQISGSPIPSEVFASQTL